MPTAITMFESIESFETERLIIKRVYGHDLSKVIMMHQDAQVMQTLGGIRSKDQSIENLEWNLQLWDKHGFGLWMIYLKDGTWIGRAGLRQVHIENRDEVEVGYALLAPFWQQGYATEIVRAAIPIAFEYLRLPNIIAYTQQTNLASQKVMRKAGFTFEKNFIHQNESHVLYRLMNYRTATLIPYDTNWPQIYAAIADKLKTKLQPWIHELHHIGSTAIPGMVAKPIIDIIIVCKDLLASRDLKVALNNLGFPFLRRNVVPHLSFFSSSIGYEPRIHLHLFETGDPQIKRHILFRDYLIAHPSQAEKYAALKLDLAKDYFNDMASYVKGKDGFVKSIDIKAKKWRSGRKEWLPPVIRTVLHEIELMKIMVANLNIHMTYFAQYLTETTLRRIPGYTMVGTDLLDDTFNYVLDTDTTDANFDEIKNEIQAYFHARNVPYAWWVSPTDQPADLEKLLLASEYYNVENNVAMFLNLHDLPIIAEDTSLTIIRALDKKTLLDFALVLTNDKTAFTEYFSRLADVITEDDPIEYYVGYVNDQPVVRGLICFYGGVAGLYWLSTAPHARHRGYAHYMQHYRLRRAKALGYQIAILQASNEGYPLYLKIGYQPCGEFKEFKE